MKLFNKSVAATALISCGVAGVLSSNYSYFSMVLFAFGLLGVCCLQLKLFTGICGYTIEENNLKEVLWVLYFNLCSAILFGVLIRIADPALQDIAISKVLLWENSFSFFIKSFYCGIIMFLAVDLYKKGTPCGIFLGIPLFILCSFQHSIANIIIASCANLYTTSLILCIIGNWLGSLFIWWLIR